MQPTQIDFDPLNHVSKVPVYVTPIVLVATLIVTSPVIGTSNAFRDFKAVADFSSLIMFIAPLLLPVALTAALVIGGVASLNSYLASRSRRKNIELFCRRNSFTYDERPSSYMYHGVLFDFGYDHTIRNRISFDDYEIGEYNFADLPKGSKNRRVYNYSYISIKLPQKIPNILFDSIRNNRATSFTDIGERTLPVSMDSRQLYKFEGNFNDYFKTYVPAEYERDALYIFTPDVLALLIDYAADFDIETVDDRMYFFSVKTFQSEIDFKRGFTVIDMMINKINRSTVRYSDEHVYDPQTGTRGVLKVNRVSMATIVFIILYILFYIVQIIYQTISSMR